MSEFTYGVLPFFFIFLIQLKCHLSEIDVLQTLIDMFAAGKDNLLLSTKWMLMALVKYPDVQANCRSEIQQVCDKFFVQKSILKKEGC